MVKQKGTPPGSGEISNVEFELQVHRDLTASQISELHTTLNVYQESFNSFRQEMMTELRAIRDATPSTDPSQLQFGTYPPVSPSLRPRMELSSSQMAQIQASMGSTASTRARPVVFGSGSHRGGADGDVSVEDQALVPQNTTLVTDANGALVSTSTMKAHVEKDKGSSKEPTKVTTPPQPTEPSQPQQFFQHSNFGFSPFNYTLGPFVGAPHPSQPTVTLTGSDLARLNHYEQRTGSTSNSQGPNPSFQNPLPSQFYGIPPYTNPPPSAYYPSKHGPFYPPPYGPPFYQYPPPTPTQNPPSQPHNPDPNLPTMRQIKLELPTFGGGDPVEWLNRADQYFSFYQIPEDWRLAIAEMHLVDRASDRWFMFRHEFSSSWSGLTELLMREFGGHIVSDYQASLARLSQTGSVDSFIDQFTRLSRRVTGFSPAVLVSCFIGGLRDNIRAHVRAQRPRSLFDACELARIFEERETSLRTSMRATMAYRGNQGQPPRNAPAAVQPRAAAPPPAVVGGPVGGTCRLTQAEYQERRARNQCFFCDEIFRPGHNCRRGLPLMAIEVIPDEVDIPGPEPVEELNVIVEEDQGYDAVIQSVGDGSASTMQLKGQCNARGVHVLNDSGASHNFLHPAVLKGSKVEDKYLARPVRVRLASGDVMQTSRQVQIALTLQGYTFYVDYYVLSISGSEVILGAAWLKTLGDIIWNFEIMRMKFVKGGDLHVLQGETETKATLVSCKSMSRILKREREAVFVHLYSSSVNTHTTEVHPKVQHLLDNYAGLFEAPTQLPPARPQDHKITLGPNISAINVRPYRYPHSQKGEIEKIISELLDNGVIRPSVSSYSSPVLLVKKKDGTWRLCVDYRALNAATIKDKFPIPVVDELLDEIHGATIFTKLDLRSGYHQIRMCEADIPKTAFRTHSGHYEFLVMPFGLTNAPSTFQVVMNDVLGDFLRKCALVFFDDILIYSASLEEHLQHLKLIFERLRQHSLKAKASKCSFGVKQVEYLGHVISAQGVAVDPSKIECIKIWPQPKTLKQLRGFLGRAGYYRKYVQGFGMIAKPLTDMLKKDSFKWSEEAMAAFEALKHALISTPVLAFPDFTKEFVVECDASDRGIGVVLSQEGHPIAFMSKALAQRHLALSVYDKEMLSVVTAVQHWRPYLLGHHFTIFTNHRTIEHFLEQRVTTPAQQKWLLKLLGYDYSIKYKTGKSNVVPDSLSRTLYLSQLLGASSTVPTIIQEITDACTSDPNTQQLMQEITKDPTGKKHYSIVNSQLLYRGRQYVPLVGDLRQRVIAELHGGLVGGHVGRARTCKRILRSFAWPHLNKEVKKYVTECEECQRNHAENIKPPGLLQPLPIPDQAWKEISMDFIEGLPKVEGKTVIWVVIDRLTKYGHFIPLAHPYTAASLAQVFVQEIFRLHGQPVNITSDRDPTFMSLFWEAFFKLQGTKLSRSMAYHPQSDGQTENLNKTVEQFLRYTVGDKPQLWVQALPWAEYWYNTSYHSSLGMTPFEALYGYLPPPIVPYLPGSTSVAQVDQQLQNRDQLLALLKQNLKRAQHRQKHYYDLKHTERSFQVGDMVFLKLQRHKQHSMPSHTFHKLSAKYYGPFKVLERIGSVAYKLELHASATIHDVFHVSLLKKKLGQSASVEPNLPPMASVKASWVPSRIIERRLIKRRGKAVVEWLILWRGANLEEATWEEANYIEQQFPDFNTNA
ncbi:uncharacterized protein LOC126796952 [Argentina anserina]|uniref:uncharacterized protein LOC126796952 n=1 Tax=Argentina anserina TaxID=57926 RepID=UPI0021765A6C|nr:uncharacterized protein LOC126796952 [Potentilla anserina]